MGGKRKSCARERAVYRERPGVALTSFYEVHLFSRRSAYANFDISSGRNIKFDSRTRARARARSTSRGVRAIGITSGSQTSRISYCSRAGSFVQIRIENCSLRVDGVYARRLEGGVIIRFSGTKVGFVFRLRVATRQIFSFSFSLYRRVAASLPLPVSKRSEKGRGKISRKSGSLFPTDDDRR